MDRDEHGIRSGLSAADSGLTRGTGPRLPVVSDPESIYILREMVTEARKRSRRLPIGHFSRY